MVASRVFLQTTSDSVDRTTYTFTGRSLGTASIDRHILVCVATRASGTTALDVSNVAVAGVSADILLSNTNIASSGANTSAIAIIAVPSGTTGTIAVTFSRQVSRCGIITYALYGIAPAPVDTDLSSGADPSSTTISIPADGIAVAFDSGYIGSSGRNWTGLTSDGGVLVEAGLLVASASDATVLAVSRSVTCDFTGSNPQGRASLVAAWGPPSGGIFFRRTRHNRSGSRT